MVVAWPFLVRRTFCLVDSDNGQDSNDACLKSHIRDAARDQQHPTSARLKRSKRRIPTAAIEASSSMRQPRSPLSPFEREQTDLMSEELDL